MKSNFIYSGKIARLATFASHRTILHCTRGLDTVRAPFLEMWVTNAQWLLHLLRPAKMLQVSRNAYFSYIITYNVYNLAVHGCNDMFNYLGIEYSAQLYRHYVSNMK